VIYNNTFILGHRTEALSEDNNKLYKAVMAPYAPNKNAINQSFKVRMYYI
jgi:hypothetical protein